MGKAVVLFDAKTSVCVACVGGTDDRNGFMHALYSALGWGENIGVVMRPEGRILCILGPCIGVRFLYKSPLSENDDVPQPRRNDDYAYHGTNDAYKYHIRMDELNLYRKKRIHGMKNTIYAACVTVLLGLVAIPNTHAALISDSMNTCFGMRGFSTGAWRDCGATLEWEVDYDSDSTLWTYQYDWNVSEGTPLNFIIQTDFFLTEANIFSGTTPGWELGWNDPSQPLNTGLPDWIWGLSFTDIPDDYLFTIVTDRAPQLASTFLFGVTQGDVVTTAANDCFGCVLDQELDIYQDIPFHMLLGPGAAVAPPPQGTVPVPGTLLLFGLGLVGLVTRRRTVVV